MVLRSIRLKPLLLWLICFGLGGGLLVGNCGGAMAADVVINTHERTIGFPAVIQLGEGWVQFLVAARGYPWIAEKSAVVTDVPLQVIQQAFAQLDWALWDQLWVEYAREPAVSLTIYMGETAHPAVEWIEADDELGFVDVFFVGCPYFDPLALGNAAVDCRSCPIFPLEQRALQEKFTRPSGELGYALRERAALAVGSPVWIEIQLPE